MIGSSRGTRRNLFNACTEERACVTRGSNSPGRAGTGKRKNAERQEEEERCEVERQKEREAPGEPGRHKETRAEQESRGAATRNGESGEASHIPEGTWLFQVCDRLRGQLLELAGKVGRDRGGGSVQWESWAQRGGSGKDPQ
ncbi:hypothetical protein NDU88_004512 [Pleurodeles waltl]|uniref:Uncharacterized protein n=1 Tax=Pleurodeles waltl TaxID=8319 RepID=A0AAV7M6I3_PLEWA|nr:hypothetical protein NDU88_004512 [Pleurodeles waltl]